MNVTFNQLPAGTTPTGAEIFPVNQGPQTVQLTLSQLLNLISGNAPINFNTATGVISISNIPNSFLQNNSISIAGNATPLGGTVTQDQITGLSSTGLIKRTGANTLANAVSGTDYQAALGFTPENVANKATDFTTLNNTVYPTTQAVENEIYVNMYFSQTPTF